MSIAYERALKNVPALARKGEIAEVIPMLAQALAAGWAHDLLADLPEGKNADLNVESFVTDCLTQRQNEHMHALAGLLGWTAGFANGDPVVFIEQHLENAASVFESQIHTDIESVLEARSPADVSNVTLKEFFLSEEMGAFLNEHAVGESPWSATFDGNGRIVFASADRSVFYTLTTLEDPEGQDQFFVLRYDDAMDVIELYSEKWTEIGLVDSPAEALKTFMEDAGLETSAPAP